MHLVAKSIIPVNLGILRQDNHFKNDSVRFAPLLCLISDKIHMFKKTKKTRWDVTTAFYQK